MKAIDLKMMRDLRNMRGQVIAIAFVIIAGVSVYMTMSSVADTLQGTLDTYYEDYQFADGFASVRRAPKSLAKRLRKSIRYKRASRHRLTWKYLDLTIP